MSGVYFREFPESDFELGVYEDMGGWFWMDVGDFAYYFYIDLSKWTLIGDL